MAKNYRKTRNNRKANRKTRRANRRSRRNTRRMNAMLGGFQDEKVMQEYKSPFVTNMVKY